MAFERNAGFLAEPEAVWRGDEMAVPDLGGWSLQNYQNQFMQNTPTVDLNLGGMGNFDYSNLNLGGFDLGAFQQQYGAPNEPVYQQPTPQLVQTEPYYDPYNLGSFNQPTAAQLAGRDIELTKPGVTGGEWDPSASSFMYDKAPKQATQPTGPYYVDPGPSDPVYNPYNIGNYDALNNAAGQMGALPGATPPQTAAAPVYKYGTITNPTGEGEVYTSTYRNNKRGDIPLSVTADTPIYLYDNKTKQILAGGTGFQAAEDVAKEVARLSAQKGSDWWDIYTGPPGSTDPNQFRSVVQDKKDSTFGSRFLDFVGTALPVAMSFVPGLQGASLLTKIGAGAAAGGLGAALKGDDILRGAAFGGVTSGVVNAPVFGGGQSLGTVASNALGQVPLVGDALRGVSKAVGGGGGSYVDPTGAVVVEATKSATPALISGALNSYLGNALNIAKQAPGTTNYADEAFRRELDEGPGWDVIAPTEQVIIPPALPTDGTGLPPGTGPDIIAEGTRQPTVKPPPAGLPDLFPPLNSVDIPPLAGTEYPEIPTDDNEIVVTAPPTIPPIMPPIIFPSTGGLPSTGPGTDTAPTDGKKPTTLDEIIKYLQLAGLGIGTIGNLFGNKGANGTGLSGARGPLNPIFSAKLPAPSLAARSPRPMNLDWYRYGYGPEQSFFTNVPQGAANTSRAYTGYAEGGYAVGGPGGGRDDKIPAMLSDGEYVMDAETVALLGNGSPKAGADALDKFRVEVRKHKGRDLAKGKFSVNAKKPEQYLKGRK